VAALRAELASIIGQNGEEVKPKTVAEDHQDRAETRIHGKILLHRIVNMIVIRGSTCFLRMAMKGSPLAAAAI